MIKIGLGGVLALVLGSQVTQPDFDAESAMAAAYHDGDWITLADQAASTSTPSTMRGLAAAALGDDAFNFDNAVAFADRSCADAPAVEQADFAQVLSEARILVINEAHQFSHHRAVVLALLPQLRDAGFTRFLFEGFIQEHRAKELATAFDVSLEEAQTWAQESGAVRYQAAEQAAPDMFLYFGDPVLHRLLSTAHTLGFVLGDFEARIGQAAASRSAGMAENIAAVFDAEPQARLVVLTGHEHASERLPSTIAILKQLTGVDPITLGQTECAPRDQGAPYEIHLNTADPDRFDYVISHRLAEARPHDWRAALLDDEIVEDVVLHALALDQIEHGVLEVRSAQADPAETRLPLVLDRVLIRGGAPIRPVYAPPGAEIEFHVIDAAAEPQP